MRTELCLGRVELAEERVHGRTGYVPVLRYLDWLDVFVREDVLLYHCREILLELLSLLKCEAQC